MSPLVASLNTILALGAIVMQTAAIILLIAYIRREPQALIALAQKNAVLLVCVLSWVGTVFTLLYSDVFGFVPCGLCWFERIFLYPIAILSSLALWRNEVKSIVPYLFTLATPGAVVSLYHHYIQMGGAEFIACPAAGADCAKRIIFEFGYITFPLLAFSLFVFIIVLLLHTRTRA